MGRGKDYTRRQRNGMDKARRSKPKQRKKFTIMLNSVVGIDIDPLVFVFTDGDDESSERHRFNWALGILFDVDDGQLKRRFEESVQVAVPWAATGMKNSWEKLEWSDRKLCPEYIRILNELINEFAVKKPAEWRRDAPNTFFYSARCDEVEIKEINDFAYSRAVPDPKKLEKLYKSFSSMTFGEITSDQFAEVFASANVGTGDIVADAGSGVGQGCTYAAGFTQARKVFGVEINDQLWPFSRRLQWEFERLMSWLGKTAAPVELIEGSMVDMEKKLWKDFVESEMNEEQKRQKEVIDKLREADVILLNNFAFGDGLMMRIADQILVHLKDGTRIICTKPLGKEIPLCEEEQEERMEKGERTSAGRCNRSREPPSVDQFFEAVRLNKTDDPTSWSDGAKVEFFLYTFSEGKMQKALEEYYGSWKSVEEKQKEKEQRRNKAKERKQEGQLEDLSDKENVMPTRKMSREVGEIGDDEFAIGEELENTVAKKRKFAEDEKEYVENNQKKRRILEPRQAVNIKKMTTPATPQNADSLALEADHDYARPRMLEDHNYERRIYEDSLEHDHCYALPWKLGDEDYVCDLFAVLMRANRPCAYPRDYLSFVLQYPMSRLY